MLVRIFRWVTSCEYGKIADKTTNYCNEISDQILIPIADCIAGIVFRSKQDRSWNPIGPQNESSWCKITGGRFKNAYELLSLNALKCSPVNKDLHLSMYEYPLKFHTKYRYDFYTN